MPKRRRKLSKDYERQISIAAKEVELLQAKINDIDEDDIREEYMTAFSIVKGRYMYISSTYDKVGFNEDSDTLLALYKESIKSFTSEYEI